MKIKWKTEWRGGKQYQKKENDQKFTSTSHNLTFSKVLKVYLYKNVVLYTAYYGTCKLNCKYEIYLGILSR